jgi:hypothetical protein
MSHLLLCVVGGIVRHLKSGHNGRKLGQLATVEPSYVAATWLVACRRFIGQQHFVDYMDPTVIGSDVGDDDIGALFYGQVVVNNMEEQQVCRLSPRQRK